MADLPDDLDQLLDSALDDFQNVNLNPPPPRRVQGLGMTLPDLRSTKKAKKNAPRHAHVSEALDKLKEQTRDAIKGLQAMNSCKISGDDLSNEELVEDWVKQFEQLAGSPDSKTVVEMMMQPLLSKEILHEPMKEMEDRYHIWLEDYGASLSTEEYNRYSGQYKLIKDLNAVYENDPNNFQHIGELMQKIQEFGHPPDDIVQDHGYDFNLLNFGPLSGDMLQSQKICALQSCSSNTTILSSVFEDQNEESSSTKREDHNTFLEIVHSLICLKLMELERLKREESRNKTETLPCKSDENI